MKATRSGSAVRAVTRRDFTKPVRVAASAKPRAKSEVFGTIVQHVGIHRRDVAGVFHVMGSMIKADLSKSGSGVFKVYPGVVMPVDAYSVAQRARELCYQTSMLHDLVGELRATAETASSKHTWQGTRPGSVVRS